MLEPGIYTTSLQGGIRLEDNYLLTAHKLENLFSDGGHEAVTIRPACWTRVLDESRASATAVDRLG